MRTPLPAVLAKAGDSRFWLVKDAQLAEELLSGSFIGFPGSPLHQAHTLAYERHQARQLGRKALKRVLARQAAEQVPAPGSDDETRRVIGERGGVDMAGRACLKASAGKDPLLQVNSLGLYHGPLVGPDRGGLSNVV